MDTQTHGRMDGWMDGWTDESATKQRGFLSFGDDTCSVRIPLQASLQREGCIVDDTCSNSVVSELHGKHLTPRLW